MKKILAIVGSLRKESFNLQLAKEAEIALNNRVEFEILDYLDIPYMNQDIEFPAPDSVYKIRQKVKKCDAIWFFTPEYNHFFPGLLKNLIDWLSRPIDDNTPPILEKKPVAISGITPGISGTGLAQDHLVTLLSFLDMKIMNKPRLTIANALEQVEGNTLILSDKNKDRIKTQADAFIEFIK